MGEYTPLESVVEIHPLDELGKDINKILSQDSHLSETITGRVLSKNIQHGDLSLFFSRFTSPNINKFTVGIDLIRDEELISMRHYQWDIYDPQSSGLNEGTLKKLRTVVSAAMHSEKLNGEA
jgi:hypothetical protein